MGDFLEPETSIYSFALAYFKIFYYFWSKPYSVHKLYAPAGTKEHRKGDDE